MTDNALPEDSPTPDEWLDILKALDIGDSVIANQLFELVDALKTLENEGNENKPSFDPFEFTNNTVKLIKSDTSLRAKSVSLDGKMGVWIDARSLVNFEEQFLNMLNEIAKDDDNE